MEFFQGLEYRYALTYAMKINFLANFQLDFFMDEAPQFLFIVDTKFVLHRNGMIIARVT